MAKYNSSIWTYANELLLINYVREHPCMWDTSNEAYKRGVRAQGFAELAKILGTDEGAVRQRWASMRTQFCREERKLEYSDKYKPTWDHYYHMQFLRKGNCLQQEDCLDDMKKIEDAVIEDAQRNINTPLNYEESNSVSENGDDFRLLPGMEIENQEQSCFQPYSNRQLSFISRSQKRFLSPQRRWSPVYNENSIHQTPVEPEKKNVILSENECFSQYICNVLTRFPTEKQRKCRNELLRVILKYDISDCKVCSDTAEQ